MQSMQIGLPVITSINTLAGCMSSKANMQHVLGRAKRQSRAGALSLELTQLPSYPVMTGRFSVSQMSRMKLASILPWRGKARTQFKVFENGDDGMDDGESNHRYNLKKY